VLKGLPTNRSPEPRFLHSASVCQQALLSHACVVWLHRNSVRSGPLLSCLSDLQQQLALCPPGSSVMAAAALGLAGVRCKVGYQGWGCGTTNAPTPRRVWHVPCFFFACPPKLAAWLCVPCVKVLAGFGCALLCWRILHSCGVCGLQRVRHRLQSIVVSLWHASFDST
jgi:hypothetical protein